MTRKSISKRIKITKKGKILHRVPGLSHAKSNKRTSQLHRKKGRRRLSIKISGVRRLMNS